MPTFVGQSVTPTKRPKTIAEIMQDTGEAVFAPIDPLSRERIRQSQFEQASRAKALDALQRGDMQEYLAQSIMAHQSAVDAEGYAQLSGVTTPDGLVVSQVPRLSPAPVTQPVNTDAGLATTPAAPSSPNTTTGSEVPPIKANGGVAATPLAPNLPTTTGPDGNSLWPRFTPLTRRPVSVSPWS